MSEAPVQVIVAAFSNVEDANALMNELKAGRKAGLIGIQDAAVVVKDGEGKLKVTDTKRRSRQRRGLITGGVVGGLVGLLAGPVGWAALGGGAIGTLAGRMQGAPLRHTMAGIGDALPANSSAIVAIIEHTWVAQLEDALIAEGAHVLRSALAADIASQLQAGGNVLYTAIDDGSSAGVARVAESPEGTQVSGVLAGEDGVFIGHAQFTDEEPVEAEIAEGTKEAQ